MIINQTIFLFLFAKFLFFGSHRYIFDSERSDECIDFTMLCVLFIFFVCVCVHENVSKIEIMLQFRTLVVVSDSKMNLVGALGRSFFEFSNTQGKTKKQLRKNGNFYAKPVFDQIDFLYGCNSKTNHRKYLKYSPNTIEIFDIFEKFFLNCSYTQIFTKSVENAKIYNVTITIYPQTILNICYYSKIQIFTNSNIDKNSSNYFIVAKNNLLTIINYVSVKIPYIIVKVYFNLKALNFNYTDAIAFYLDCRLRQYVDYRK
ncbi:Uncharacterized protein FWK35_00007800, partial [Aphis craccivora]